MQTMHEGGIFTTRALDRDSEDAAGLRAIHRETLMALGMKAGVTHSEFIKAKSDGKFYFLETAARVVSVVSVAPRVAASRASGCRESGSAASDC